MLALLTCLLLVHQALAHMEMVSPFPLRSPRDPAVTELLKDYDMTSPLLADGSNFACKRYQYSDTNPQANDIKAIYQAGNTYNMSLQGSATHNGGSCQISLSYDNGQSFKVIKSIIGGCPLTLTYNFTIPSFAPSSSSVLLSWSWFNVVGNREMYQNCARVQINGAGSQRSRRDGKNAVRRQTSMDGLPNMFVCNVNNGCNTVERREVVYADPGSNVQFGQDAIVVDSGPGFVIDAASTTSSATSQTSAPPSPFPATTNSSTESTAAFTTAYTVASASETPPFPLLNSSTTSAQGQSLSTFTTVTEASSNMTTTSTVAGSLTPSSLTGTTENMTSTTPEAPTTTSSTLTATSESGTSAAYSSFTVTPLSSTYTTSSASSSIISTSPTVSSDTVMTTTLSSTWTFSYLPSSSPITATPSLSSATNSSSPDLSTTQSNGATSITPESTLPTTLPTTLTTSFNTNPPAASPNPLPLPCNPGVFACNTPTTFSRCLSDASGFTYYIFYGSTAPGMICQDGQFIRENAGACTPDGDLFCNGENAFFLCDHGGLIDMGPTAPGTMCQDGVIVAA